MLSFFLYFSGANVLNFGAFTFSYPYVKLPWRWVPTTTMMTTSTTTTTVPLPASADSSFPSSFCFPLLPAATAEQIRHSQLDRQRSLFPPPASRLQLPPPAPASRFQRRSFGSSRFPLRPPAHVSPSPAIWPAKHGGKSRSFPRRSVLSVFVSEFVQDRRSLR